MKASFVLLATPDIHNHIRKLSWDIHQKYRTGTRHAALPPHILLNRPFGVPDLPAIETYMDKLAASTQPFDLTLTELQAAPVTFDGVEYGVLRIDVEETAPLRRLHERLNRDLDLLFGDNGIGPNGAAYRFHMTVMLCGQLMEICRKYRNEFQPAWVNLRYTARELGMILYDEPLGPHGDYLCYRILPLTGQTFPSEATRP